MSSGSDSDSDDSNAESDLSNFIKQSSKNEATESGNSSPAEDDDDFNPFKMSGSEDEGSALQKLLLTCLKIGSVIHV